ncbi:uncharacterized protein G2W53_025656 [Senna tora]|uniref:Uncharacterized protein n=1 Tax=Senna tora TaxID=362788 RepID=A0A834TFM8_9FABA|nr:uncharacterized protein G2W53_025656 [Senna tora]
MDRIDSGSSAGQHRTERVCGSHRVVGPTHGTHTLSFSLLAVRYCSAPDLLLDRIIMRIMKK